MASEETFQGKWTFCSKLKYINPNRSEEILLLAARKKNISHESLRHDVFSPPSPSSDVIVKCRRQVLLSCPWEEIQNFLLLRVAAVKRWQSDRNSEAEE